MKSTNSIHWANLATAIAGFAALFIPAVHAQQSATTPMREIYCTSGRTERQQHRYVAGKQGMMLFNSATDNRKWLNYLLIDNTKTPALYLCTRKNTARKLYLLMEYNQYPQVH